MDDLKIAVVTPARTSSGGSAFATNLVPALRSAPGVASVVDAELPPMGRPALPEHVRRASHVVFVGSRAVRVEGATTVFWPLNVAPFERHVARAEASSLRNRARHLALLRRLGRSVAAADALVFGSFHARTLYQSAYPRAARLPYLVNRGGTPSGLEVRHRDVDPGRPLVLVVSHLYPYKGVREFVDAVAETVQRVPAGVRFRVAGADRDSAYARAVHQQVVRLGLGDRLVVAPAAPDEMAALYAQASLCVFTSTCENAGSFALYDGLHAGVPTICSDRSSMPEMVRDTALAVNPCQPSRMADAIVSTLQDPRELARLSEAARAWASDAPTWTDRAAWLADFLRKETVR